MESMIQRALIRRAQRERFRRSSALLLVLACMALLSIMIVALFLSLTSEVHSSKLYASSASVKLLSQTAVNLVEGEIFQATSDTNAPCWASEPGMIRTYDNAGNAHQYYKLYSDALMTGPGAFDHTAAINQVPDGTANSGNAIAWYNQKGVYVDLNQPLNVNGTNQYPIVDGDLGPNDLTTGFAYDGNTGANSLAKLVTPTPSTGSVTVYQPTYVNSAGVTTPQVSGFWVNSNTPINPNSPNQVPMPVKWLYVLKDGGIAYPDNATAANSGTVTFSGATGAGAEAPSQNNPIVGRIAFWTDDESTKVNINTAAEGAYNNPTTYATTFNDTPRVCTPYDLNLENCPSFQNEFQRYPGHPSTVSLSTVFGNLTTSSGYPENIYSTSTSTNIAPRTIGGGSKEAQVAYVVGQANNAASALLNNRLYATADELLLSPSPSPTGTRTLTSTTLDEPAMRRAQFFITASSRAPDVNLFNLPRVSIWPINAKYPASNAYTTAYDQAIAFCTTLAGQPYYFQRKNWMSPNELWSVPSTDPAYVQRNFTLVSYLKTLCSQAIPGFGGNFAAKYATQLSTANFPASITAPPNPGTDMDQILMEIFDYVRSTNIYDTSLNASATTTGNQFNAIHLNYGAGEVVPTYNANLGTKGFGRFPTISKAGILFIASGDSTHKQITGGTATAPTGTTANAGHVRVQAALVFQLFDPSQNYPAVTPDCQIRAGNSTLTWNPSTGSAQMFPNITGSPSSSTQVLNTYSGNNQSAGWGGEIGTLPLVGGYTTSNGYITPVADFLLNTNGTSTGTITFSGSVEVQVITSSTSAAVSASGTASSAPNTVVQDITFTFPSASVPTPVYIPPSATWVPTSSTTTFVEYPSNFLATGDGTITGRLTVNTNHGVPGSTGFYGDLFVGTGDVLQSIQSASGDLRLIAANATISPTLANTLLGPHELYGTYASPLAHSFIDGLGLPFFGATRGQLAGNVSSYWSSATTTCALSSPFNVAAPANSSGGSNDLATILPHPSTNPYQTCEPEGFGTKTTGYITGVISGSTSSWASGQALGDFDNGFGCVRDGSYINKADEGGLLAASNYLPYFMDSGQNYTSPGNQYFSPARQMPSAVMFGSLPTGVFANRPWQTLLFHPDTTITTATGIGKHAGGKGRSGTGAALTGAPHDSLLLDLFTMPVVEPYAISEPLSTAGRINMNYLIVPFTYINRDTGLRAVLESQQMLSVPNGDSGSIASNVTTYKQMFNFNSHNPVPTFTTAPTTLRFGINLDETLKYFAARFYPKAFNLTTTAPDIFRSPAEICTLDLIPNDPNDGNAKSDYQSTGFTANMANYWNNHQLTGDNSKERPYANIYPLLTTKSNTYTVHFRVQSLQPLQGPNATPTEWREGTDTVLSEYRGSQTIERYVDPALLAGLPDYAAAAQAGNLASATPLSNSYRFRVDSTRQFSP